MANLKIKRVNYARHNGNLYPRSKTIFEKLEDDCYRIVEYAWSKADKAWFLMGSSGYYDGEKLHETGHILITRTDIDRMLEMMVKYGGYEYMKDGEVNTSTDEDLARIKELNKNNVEKEEE